ncbi:carboxy terminal-processing peptidase [Fulvivirga lutimaris]|uniref:carboxy terminal-processing peptidase n=1 Tax=Fulvivirga lutimaris TaxID=1819566 RepID=UPI0012BB4CEC|nr:carboxy terminal-processing peptidase [Fulvivirga lutimaris]MTI38051.1 tail-specific protease [Fulvivirga lutimaris]
MNRLKAVVVCGLVLIFSGGFSFANPSDSTDLVPKPHFASEAQLAAQILSTYHFRKISFNDSLSSVILDDYIETLDNNKSYFLESDIEDFKKYRYVLDDYTKEGVIDPAYAIYKVFKQRFDERMDYIYTTLLNYDYDFTVDEYYDTDRSEEPWSKDEAELNEQWKKIIKSQTLSLKLNGKEKKEIAKTIKTRYDRFKKSIDQYNAEDVFELYMNTIAEAFDPHSNYFSPKTSDRFQQNMSLSLEGIGARLQTDNDFTKVVEIIPGGPAKKSDAIHPDDRIIAVGQGVDGDLVDVIGWRIDDVVTLIKGPKGTTVRLEILPAETGVNGPSETITLVREKIKLEDMEAKAEVIPVTRNGSSFEVGVITLPSFYMDFEAYQKGDANYNSTTRDVKRLVNELKAKEVDGILIDLRNNGGGSLSEAIDLTGLFIKDGPVVQVKTSSNKVEVGEDEDPEVVYDGPLAVLINRFSASASEIFAGAIQDYHRGVVLGETTFGKGTVQSVIDLGRYIKLPEGEKAGELKLTLQKFYRVTGSSTQHLGVSPDVNFPSAFEAKEFGESSRPSALPWDQIKSTKFKPSNQISPQMISALNQDYTRRLESDKDLIQLVDETAELKENISRTRISLNEETRKKEIEDAEKRKAARNDLSGTKIEVEGQQKPDKIDVDDKYLKEGVVILSEIISSIG